MMERTSEGGSFTLDVQSTTGGSFTLNLDRAVTVDQLKKLVSRRLKLSKDRICLLHRERQLREGTLEENGLADGARVILLPSVETGLLSQRTENSVMQALESLNDTQVNDFLSGKSPLNLTMRLGDHTMLIQLQLSTLHPNSTCTRRVDTASTSRRREAEATLAATPKKTSTAASAVSPKTSKPKEEDKKSSAGVAQQIETKEANKEAQEMLIEPAAESVERSPIKSLSQMATAPMDESEREITPTKYVPLPSSVKNNLIKTLPVTEAGGSTVIDDTITDPIAANLTSCLCASLNPDLPCSTGCGLSDMVMVADASVGTDNTPFDERGSFLAESALDEYPMENFFNSAVDQGLFEEPEEVSMDREMSNLARPTTASHASDATVADPLPSFQNLADTNKNKRLHYLLHKTSKYKHPIAQSKQKAFMQSVVNKHIKRNLNRQDPSQPSTSRADSFVSPRKLTLLNNDEETDDNPQPSTSRQSPKLFRVADGTKKSSASTTISFPDTKALIEASKNLTQTLKKLSKEVLISKTDESESEDTMRTKTGAVIESMKHHGKGIYSGTFSGTLNPALQDRFGRPKRDISTIIHILNDLLCATPPFTTSTKESKRTLPALPSSKSECTCPATCSSCGVSCEYGRCDGHSQASDERKPCVCKARLERKEKCGCGDNATCAKCDTAKALANDNSKTKCKVEQLRLVMQQKKQRREARKLQAGPYAKPPSPRAKASPDRIDTVA